MDHLLSVENSHVDGLHDISVRLGTGDAFHEVLKRVELAARRFLCGNQRCRKAQRAERQQRGVNELTNGTHRVSRSALAGGQVGKARSPRKPR